MDQTSEKAGNRVCSSFAVRYNKRDSLTRYALESRDPEIDDRDMSEIGVHLPSFMIELWREVTCALHFNEV